MITAHARPTVPAPSDERVARLALVTAVVGAGALALCVAAGWLWLWLPAVALALAGTSLGSSGGARRSGRRREAIAGLSVGLTTLVAGPLTVLVALISVAASVN